ncbi:hypothetical protein SR870_02565 [Rhodopseudomonas palustris]|uniref:hypothetical protein n=1 Tax=Rhodopseudomonas palustris TaxID=1076 RepID=UPI002ACE6D5F|nr:hypothetical protein [Rhodopseudomonas palustris]WQH00196.1 hypothetical protein SR870_02565 [Rhodopseudomonas palustris]
MADVSLIHQAILRTGVPDDGAIQRALAKITEMQWKAIELAIIFSGSAGQLTIEGYQQDLDGLRSALSTLQKKEDLLASQRAVERLSASTVQVIKELAGLAGLGVGRLQAPNAR